LDEFKSLICIEGYVAIFCPIETLNVYVFDSHSIVMRDLSIPDGTSVLMQFDSL